MATAYKTPGVYVEEIPKFPPSIAPVATAVPAFIGYTETDTDVVAHDLHLKPTRITSIVDYQFYFGNPQPEQKITVTVTETQDSGQQTAIKAVAEVDEAQRSKHLMY